MNESEKQSIWFDIRMLENKLAGLCDPIKIRSTKKKIEKLKKQVGQ